VRNFEEAVAPRALPCVRTRPEGVLLEMFREEDDD
jgi:hypothetical protein